MVVARKVLIGHCGQRIGCFSAMRGTETRRWLIARVLSAFIEQTHFRHWFDSAANSNSRSSAFAARDPFESCQQADS